MFCLCSCTYTNIVVLLCSCIVNLIHRASIINKPTLINPFLYNSTFGKILYVVTPYYSFHLILRDIHNVVVTEHLSTSNTVTVKSGNYSHFTLNECDSTVNNFEIKKNYQNIVLAKNSHIRKMTE